MLVSNFLESKSQSKISRIGGQMLDQTMTENNSFNNFVNNFKKFIIPATITMMCGTVTYPIAVRVAKRVFRLKGFFAIHFSIAPFLAVVHVNIFGALHAYFRIKILE